MQIICKGSGKDAERQKWRFLPCTPHPIKEQFHCYLALVTLLSGLLRSFCNCAGPWLLMRRVPKNLDLLFKNNPGQHSQTCGAAKNLVAVPIMIHKLLLLVEKPWFYASSAAHAHVMDHGLRAAHASMSVPITT